MNNELKFLCKLLRNGAILAGLFFISIFATNDFSWQICKTVLIFYIGYVLTELAIKYKIKMPVNKKFQVRTTLFF